MISRLAGPLSGLLFFLSASIAAEEAVSFKDGLSAYQQRNYLEAYYIWNSLASEGDPVSAYNLGILFAQGLGVDRDPDKAAGLYLQSAESGYALAQFSLGMVYFAGEGVGRDYKQAALWWVKAAEQENVQATFNLAELYQKGHGVKKDVDIARRLYQKAADLGDLRAIQLLSGGKIQNKKEVRAPRREVLSKVSSKGKEIRREEWIQQQPKNNYTVQIFASGSESRAVDHIRDNGLMVDTALFQVDEDENAWFKVVYGSFDTRRAAVREKDELSALFPEQEPWLRKFSDVHEEINGLDHDGKSKEVANIEKSDAAADVNEQLRRAQFAFNKQSYEEAFALWEPLAKIDFVEAQYALGFMYESGWGVEQDYTKAFDWYGKAAESGHVKSQYNLGILYVNGLGVDQNLNKGRYWIQTAANNSDARAVDYLKYEWSRKK
ncbi:SPOR domain-containing protein [Gammaproteobacteria bacterium]|nr:SPOR domain-containing protein [Gammaproteobacteria bacterium]